MSNKLYTCPMCKQSNIAEFWDKHTAEVEGYDINKMMGVASSEEDMKLQLPVFRCPICNEEVEGLDIQSHDE